MRNSSSVTLSADKMYSFSSRNGVNGAKEVVDLTTSPRKPINGRPLRPSVNPGMGPKKLVVKNLRTTTRSDPTQYLNSTWEKLDTALTVIFNRSNASEPLKFSMEELYRGVENVCKQNNAEQLCMRLQEKCRSHMINGLKAPLLNKLDEKKVYLLKEVIATWKRWNEQFLTIRAIFFYLDRAYLLQSSKPSLQDMAVALFRSTIFEDSQLNARIIGGACDVVAADRAGASLDLSIFRDAINMFHELGTYTKEFEPRLLEASQTYIVTWAERVVAEESLAEYVRMAQQLIQNELKRCEMFNLDTSTRRELLTLLETHLIQKRQERLVNGDDVADLLDDNAGESIGQLYKLLERRRLGTKLRPAFQKWIDDTGTAIVFDEKDQDNMVVKLLTLKKQLDTLWRVSFNRNTELGHGLREAFEAFMNKTKKSSGTWNTDNSKPGEMIAKYVDMLLRGGAKMIPTQLSSIKVSTRADDDEADDVAIDEDSEINNQLDQVLDLFRFIHGKAVFEAFYKKDLARRLLMGRSASADAERSMLSRLKTECGAGFTQNLEQMFKDVELAREEMKSYNDLATERGEKTIVDLNVNVLSQSAWPSYPDIPMNIPMSIKVAIDKFEGHYKLKHSGRKLAWKHALAHCQIKADFPKGKKEIVVSSFQAIVLLIFNGVGMDEHISHERLKAETGLPEAELNRTLQSLACAKLRPLSKHPKGREINPTDTFTLNANFDHPKYRIKINQVQLKETPQENKETHERVQVERSFETQAAIVRIMKSRKQITHNELVAEVITATKSRGVLAVSDIKKNIDRLIDKDYMERNDDGSYSYVA
ncbi:cullin-4B [Rhizodiscina lignyota]|uniref:Cullin-4B n=1 Tax=Rhizodiscina lignyota TaxID=1504668 RepID=A0A9P4IMV2_9PEZI|nr:cullin-4B [Rhizodiscina lignyota]